jgi:prepilin-type N-terminal cleavage/methylation domain-containing protein
MPMNGGMDLSWSMFYSQLEDMSKGPILSRKHHACGFTLVEMLVVMAIVALLIAMLLPVIGQAREASRRTICASQLRQWGVIVEAYANEFREQYPTRKMWGQNDMFSAGTVNWIVGGVADGTSTTDLSVRKLPEYGMAKRRLLECPSRFLVRIYRNNLEVATGTYGTDYFSFFGRADHPNQKATEGWIYWSPSNIRGPVPSRTYRKSLKTIMAMDRCWVPATINNWYYDGGPVAAEWGTSNHLQGPLSPTATYPLRQTYALLGDGANALTIDSSVRWMNMTGPTFNYGHDYYYSFYVDASLRFQ